MAALDIFRLWFPYFLASRAFVFKHDYLFLYILCQEKNYVYDFSHMLSRDGKRKGHFHWEVSLRFSPF
jgi:hypothetical protein